MSYKMEEFAKNSIKSFGISELTAKQTGSTFMAMSKGMGIAEGASSDMAISLTGLSADMSSFYNVRQDVASTALKSIFTGETETLKQFGIVMTQANLQAFAYSQGINQNVSDMDQATITQLRYMYVMQQTSMAQGDFAKTYGSWANQTRILAEQWKQFLGILGSGLIKILSPVLSTLNATMAYMIDFANTAGKVLSSIFGFSDANDQSIKSTKAATESANAAADSLGKVGKAAKKAGKNAKGSVSDFDKLHNVTESTASSSKDAAGNISGLGSIGTSGGGKKDKVKDKSGIDKNMLAMIEKIKKVLEPASAALERLKKAFEPFAKNIGDGLKWFFDNVLVPLGKWTVSKWLPAWLDNLGATITLLNSILEAFKPAGLWLWDNFLQPIATWTGGLIVDTLNLVTKGLLVLSDWINNNEKMFVKMTALIASFFIAFNIAGFLIGAASFIAALASAISSGVLLSAILTVLSTTIGTLLSPVALLTATIGLLIFSFIDLYSKSESFRNSVSEMGATWSSALKPLADFVGTVLSDAWSKILKPAVDFFVSTLIPNLIATFENLWRNVLIPLANFIGTVLQPVFKILADVFKMIWKNIILPLAQAVGTIFVQAWKGIYEILNKTVIPIIKIVISVLTSLWKNFINPIISVLWKNFKPAFDTVFGGIKTVINGLNTTFSGIITFITGVFTGNWSKAWDGIKKIFKGVFDALVGIVKTPINLIIDIINGMIGGIVSGVNTVIGAINSIKVSIPDWVPGIGGKGIGFNIPKLKAPQIPKLATGAVIPPNSEFLAMLGDQKRGVNIEAPLATIVDAFKKVQGQGSSSSDINLTINLDGKQIFTTVVKQDKEYQMQNGKSAFAY